MAAWLPASNPNLPACLPAPWPWTCGLWSAQVLAVDCLAVTPAAELTVLALLSQSWEVLIVSMIGSWHKWLLQEQPA